MAKTRVKRILAVLLLAGSITLLWLTVRGIAHLTAYFQRGADPASALNLIPNGAPDMHVKLAWLPTDTDIGRAMEPFTQAQIETTYLQAWLQWSSAHLRGEPIGLKTYFVGPALTAVRTSISQTADQHLMVSQTNLEHHLKFHFYAADGSIVAFTDQDALVAYVITDDAGQVIFAGETRVTYDVVMFLVEGTWRVRHMVRTNGTPLGSIMGTPVKTESANAASSVPGIVIRSGTRLLVDGEPYQVAGINYYPQATPWDAFWPNYDSQVIDADFERMRGLGINSVRIFIPFAQFGGPDIDTAMVQRLRDLLDQAAEHELKVIVTLFDFRTDYRLLLWPQADRHLETLLTTFADHPAILAWDLKNEPDRDDTSNGQATVDAWLTHMARLARIYDPNHLITIGWSTPEAAQRLTSHVDFVSFHSYAPATDLPARYAALRATAPDRPIVLTEFGLPTWNSFFFPHGHTEAEQAQYYADTLTVLRETDSAGHLAWTLYDFDQVPATVAGRFPWNIGPQKHLGILRVDGTPKPAASLLTPAAVLDGPRVPGWQRFIKPFWLTLFLVVVGASSSVFVWLRQRRMNR